VQTQQSTAHIKQSKLPTDSHDDPLDNDATTVTFIAYVVSSLTNSEAQRYVVQLQLGNKQFITAWQPQYHKIMALLSASNSSCKLSLMANCGTCIAQWSSFYYDVVKVSRANPFIHLSIN